VRAASLTDGERGDDMRAFVVGECAPVDEGPLRALDRAEPVPGPGQVRVRITCCGVCRTDLHLAEGDLPPRRPGVTPGHEIVGVVDALGPGASRFVPGDRIGIPWLASTDGTCSRCRRGAENLCRHSLFTGWDVDGGYADACVAREAYAYRLPDALDDEHAAPLLCAGIIGYRALLRAEVPAGGRLGIYGFGGSAHITAQIALHQGLRVHVLTRGEGNRKLAAELGADSVGDASDEPPEPLDGAILFAPAGELVPVALRALDQGGTLAIAGIWLSGIPVLDYERELFGERQVRSVTANTRRDGEEFLALAARFAVRTTTVAYPMIQAPRALADLAHGRFSGAAVLHN
jgi:propanol-preferring alcohol dehydrogenase